MDVILGAVIRVPVKVVVKFDNPFEANDLAAASVGVPLNNRVALASEGMNPGDWEIPLASVKLIPLGSVVHVYKRLLAD